MNIKQKYETLHCHTKASDGEFDHLEVLDLCSKNNIGTVAFTDHDTLISKHTLTLLKNYSGSVNWISGIEMSSGLPKEIELPNADIHLVGLFINPFNTQIVEHSQKVKQSRIERMENMVKNLQNLGFNITNEDCLKASNGESVGRPHIVKAIKSKAKNLEIIEYLRTKMEKQSKNDLDIKAKFDEMMAYGEDQYPYVLFLSDDAFIPNIYVHYAYKLDLDKSVKIIRDSGGIAQLAHWFTDIKNITPEILENLLKNNRLDGAETVYGFDALENSVFFQQRNVLQNMISKYNKVEGGGFDIHKTEHFLSMKNNDWYSKLTVGLTQRILESHNINTTFSSFKS